MKRQQGDAASRLLAWAGIVLCLTVMLAAAYRIARDAVRQRAGEAAYAALRTAAAAQTAADARPEADATGGPGKQAGMAGGASQAADLTPAAPVRADADALRAIGAQAVGWIYCEDTLIDYPVMQAADNSYYLSRLPDGKRNGLGSIFLDCRNAGDFTDQNSLLYGHHMKSGKMFAALEKYKQQEFYDEHPVMYLDTPEGPYRIELFAAVVLDGSKNSLDMQFESGEAFLAFIETIRAQSAFTSSVAVGAEDRIVSLVTCTYNSSNARLAVLGKLTRLYADAAA